MLARKWRALLVCYEAGASDPLDRVIREVLLTDRDSKKAGSVERSLATVLRPAFENLADQDISMAPPSICRDNRSN